MDEHPEYGACQTLARAKLEKFPTWRYVYRHTHIHKQLEGMCIDTHTHTYTAWRYVYRHTHTHKHIHIHSLFIGGASKAPNTPHMRVYCHSHNNWGPQTAYNGFYCLFTTVNPLKNLKQTLNYYENGSMYLYGIEYSIHTYTKVYII